MAQRFITYPLADSGQVVGRGGQVLIALCSWHVFGLYVTTSMETAPITYHSYRAVFLETSPSFWSTLFLARDFIWLKSLHSKMAMFFMIFTMVFTLCFPTFASAMTGYTSIVQAYVLDRQNANWIRFDTESGRPSPTMLLIRFSGIVCVYKETYLVLLSDSS